MSGVAYYSRNVFDDIKFRSTMPVVAEAPDVAASRLRPAMGASPSSPPGSHGRFFSLNRTGPGVRRCVLRVPYPTLKFVSTVVKGYAEVSKVEYFNEQGLCDIHLNYVVSALGPLRDAVEAACPGKAQFLSAEAPKEATPERKAKALLERRAEARALCKAARKGDLAEVRRMVAQEGVDLLARQHDGTTPLHHAAAPAHVHVVEWLMDNGADAAAKDHAGRTPADAARAGDAADPAHPRHHRLQLTLRSLEGKSIFRAAKDGDAMRVEFLLDSGADANAPNAHGVTPLHLAVVRGEFEVVHLLLDRGADPRVRNGAGKSPLDIAEERGRAGHRMATLLRRQIARLDRSQAQKQRAASSEAQSRVLGALAHEARARAAAELRQATRGTTAARLLRLAEQQVLGQRRRPDPRRGLLAAERELRGITPGVMGPPRLARPGSRPAAEWSGPVRGEVAAAAVAAVDGRGTGWGGDAAAVAAAAAAAGGGEGGRRRPPAFLRGSGSASSAALVSSIRSVEAAQERITGFRRLREAAAEQGPPPLLLALPADEAGEAGGIGGGDGAGPDGDGDGEGGDNVARYLKGVTLEELTSTNLVVSERLGITIDGVPRREAEAKWGSVAPPRGWNGRESTWERHHARDPSLRGGPRGTASHSVSRLALTGQLPAVSEVAAAWERHELAVEAEEARRGWSRRRRRRPPLRRQQATAGGGRGASSRPGGVEALEALSRAIAESGAAAADPAQAGPLRAAARHRGPEFDPANASSRYLASSGRRQRLATRAVRTAEFGPDSAFGAQLLSTRRSRGGARMPPQRAGKETRDPQAREDGPAGPPAGGKGEAPPQDPQRHLLYSRLETAVRAAGTAAQAQPTLRERLGRGGRARESIPDAGSAGFDSWYRRLTGD